MNKGAQVGLQYACHRVIDKDAVHLWHTLPHDNLISPKIHGAKKIKNYYTW